MKLVRQILWIIVLILVVDIFAQNMDFLLFRYPFTIHLGFIGWTFPNTTVIVLVLSTFVLGFLIAYLASLTLRYRLHRKGQQYQQQLREKENLLAQKEKELATCHQKVASLEVPHEQIELPEPKI